MSRSSGHEWMTPTAGFALIAIASAAVALVFGGLVEAWVIDLVKPSSGALTWISDLVIAVALGLVLYLWLHLRMTRAALLDVERNGIVLNTQLAIAANIQRSLLPPTPEPRNGISWAVQLAAAGRIGGDYYDFIDVDGTSQVFLIADISGKGIPAAMMLVYVRTVFRQAVRETSEPRQIVSRLAQAVHADTGGSPYLTCIVARLNGSSGCMTSTNAGHPPAIITGTRLRRLEAGGPPAGLLPEVAYEQEVVHLDHGDRVVFVTDGVSECLPGDLDSAVADLDRSASAPALCASVFRLSDDRTAAAPVENWDDDRTVVVLAYETHPKTGI